MTVTNNDHDGHNHDDQLGEIYPKMLNELICTFGISFLGLQCCGCHDHGLWPSWFVAIVVCGHRGCGHRSIMVCGRRGIGPKTSGLPVSNNVLPVQPALII